MYIPPLIKLGHGHIEICLVLITFKLLIDMVFKYVNMHFLTSFALCSILRTERLINVFGFDTWSFRNIEYTSIALLAAGLSYEQ